MQRKTSSLPFSKLQMGRQPSTRLWVSTRRQAALVVGLAATASAACDLRYDVLIRQHTSRYRFRAYVEIVHKHWYPTNIFLVNNDSRNQSALTRTAYLRCHTSSNHTSTWYGGERENNTCNEHISDPRTLDAERPAERSQDVPVLEFVPCSNKVECENINKLLTCAHATTADIRRLSVRRWEEVTPADEKH